MRENIFLFNLIFYILAKFQTQKKKNTGTEKGSISHSLTYSLTHSLTQPYLTTIRGVHRPTNEWRRMCQLADERVLSAIEEGEHERTMAILGELFSTVALLSSSPRPSCCDCSSSLASCCIAFVVLVLAVRVCCLCSFPFVICEFARSSSWQVHWQ
jgi:hypothetical protein